MLPLNGNSILVSKVEGIQSVTSINRQGKLYGFTKIHESYLDGLANTGYDPTIDTTLKLEESLRFITLDGQQHISDGTYVHRELSVERIGGKATVISGVRSVGKSVYQRLYMKALAEKGIPKGNFCILDFSDDRLFHLRHGEPSIISDVYYTLFPEKMRETVYFFFDEIQYLHHWELFVNRLQNTRPCEVNITESSAKLLVKEIAPEFGGRSLA